MASCSKGYFLFDCFLSLVLISLYLPLLIQGILTIRSHILNLQTYDHNLNHLYAYINDAQLSYPSIFIHHRYDTFVTMSTDFFGSTIRWVHVSP